MKLAWFDGGRAFPPRVTTKDYRRYVEELRAALQSREGAGTQLVLIQEAQERFVATVLRRELPADQQDTPFAMELTVPQVHEAMEQIERDCGYSALITKCAKCGHDPAAAAAAAEKEALRPLETLKR